MNKRSNRKRVIITLIMGGAAVAITVVAAVLDCPWICLGTIVCMGVAIVFDD